MSDILKDKVSIYSKATLPTHYGTFTVHVFHNQLDNKEHLAMVYGDIENNPNIPVRVHSECLTSEVFGSLKCDCKGQLDAGLEYIVNHGFGVLLYMRQEGRGIGLGNKIRAYALQEKGYDTVEANHLLGFPDDLRSYEIAAGMLLTLGVKQISLLTNNPKKISGLEEYGVETVERIPLEIIPNSINEDYLLTKQKKSGHLLDIKKSLKNVDLAV